MKHARHDLAFAAAIGAAVIGLVYLADALHSGQLYVLDGDTDCIQQTADANALPFAPPSGAIRGALLGPWGNDLDDWIVPAGKWNRTGTYCDPGGYPVTITCLGGTLDPNLVTVDVNDADGTWRAAADVTPGDHWLWFQASNRPPWSPPHMTIVTVAFHVPEPNVAPPVVR